MYAIYLRKHDMIKIFTLLSHRHLRAQSNSGIITLVVRILLKYVR